MDVLNNYFIPGHFARFVARDNHEHMKGKP